MQFLHRADENAEKTSDANRFFYCKRIRCVKFSFHVLLNFSMVLKRFRCRHETLLLVQKDASAAEEASHCTLLDDSSGNSSQSTHGAVKGAMESKVGSLMAPEAAIDVRRNNSDGSEARKVSFDYVLVKEFDRIIGDNPSCSFGVPIS